MRKMLTVWLFNLGVQIIALIVIGLILLTSDIQNSTKIAIAFGAILQAIIVSLIFIVIGAWHQDI